MSKITTWNKCTKCNLLDAFGATPREASSMCNHNWVAVEQDEPLPVWIISDDDSPSLYHTNLQDGLYTMLGDELSTERATSDNDELQITIKRSRMTKAQIEALPEWNP